MSQCILANLPGWIQTLAAVSIVILTLLTLIVLRRYAADTKTIADASASQTENSQMPFLAVAMTEGTHAGPGGWIIQNQGFGPAINISYSQYTEAGRSMRPIPPLGQGSDRRNLHNEISNALRREEGFEIQYESLSGVKYRTTVKMVNGGTETRFHKP